MAERKLTKLQADLLARLCNSNGGGVSRARLTKSEKARLDRLVELGLAQEKSSNEYRAVHTPEGLKLHRSMQGAQ